MTVRISREFEDAVERERSILLQFHRVAPARIDRSASGPKIHLQRNERPGHHALAAKERQDQRVVAPEHRAYLAHARAPEAYADRVEQARADAGLPRVRFDVDREDPAAGRRSEFPVAYFADDEPDDALPGIGHEELPLHLPGVAVTPVDGSPVVALFQPRHRGIDGDDLREIAALHRPDDDGIRRRGAAGAATGRPAARAPSHWFCRRGLLQRMTQINSIGLFRYQNTPSNRYEEVAMAVTCKARVPMLVAAIAFGGEISAVGAAFGQE